MVVRTHSDLLTAEQRLRRRLATKPSDAEWAWLEDERWVADALLGDATPEELDSKLRAIRASQRQSRGFVSATEDQTPASVADWAGALAHVLAAEAGRVEAVTAFRAELLQGRLLAQGDVERWVMDHTEGDCETTLLAYPSPDGAVVARRAVRSEAGVRLHELSQALADRFLWQPAQAAAFVLTDDVPMPALHRVTTNMAFPPWKNRITIEVHPIVDPASVEAAYREARKKYLGWLFPGQRIRTRERRCYEVVAWLAWNKADTWVDYQQMWNAEHPGDPFPDPSSFRRSAMRGAESILGPGSTFTLGDD